MKKNKKYSISKRKTGEILAKHLDRCDEGEESSGFGIGYDGLAKQAAVKKSLPKFILRIIDFFKDKYAKCKKRKEDKFHNKFSKLPVVEQKKIIKKKTDFIDKCNEEAVMHAENGHVKEVTQLLELKKKNIFKLQKLGSYASIEIASELLKRERVAEQERTYYGNGVTTATTTKGNYDEIKTAVDAKVNELNK
jgi:hypothetical protein